MKTAVIIYNLGGPDKTSAIRPFLYNLFTDPNIIALPWGMRQALAWIIATSRAPKVKPLYAEMGGRSPILENTQTQADALEAALGANFKVFVAMRYWHPFAHEVARDVKKWGADQVVLLPLYPQLSTTTTTSFTRVWGPAARKCGLSVPTKTICCYPAEEGFAKAQSEKIKPFLKEAAKHGTPRVLFSAHGLPEKIVKNRHDPYPQQVQLSATKIVTYLTDYDFEWRVSFQSRVGPLEWVKPYTQDEIIQAGADKMPLVIVPLAFVCEHLETLVELDVEYREVAHKNGVPYYGRVPAVGAHPAFIEGLKNLVTRAMTAEADFYAAEGCEDCERLLTGS